MARTLLDDLKGLWDDERATETPAYKAEQLDRIKRNMDIAGASLNARPKASPGNIGSRVDFSDEKMGPKFRAPKKITKKEVTVEGDIGSVDTSNPDVIGPNMGQVNTAAPVISAPAPQLTAQQQAQNLLSRGYATPGMKRGGKVKAKCKGGKMSSGGKVTRSSASKRGDGCATKGHTKGRYL
jgi:hypothetical protein